MNLDQKITDFLARTETKPAASKLEPYVELIRTLRQRRWTFVQIAQVLREDFGVQVHPTTVHAFVKVRRKKGESTELLPRNSPSAPTVALPRKRRFNLDA